MQRRWQLQLTPDIPVEITREDDTWTVVAAGAVRSRNTRLAAALRDTVGHLIDHSALDHACRTIEASTTNAPAAETKPRLQRERRSLHQSAAKKTPSTPPSTITTTSQPATADSDDV